MAETAITEKRRFARTELTVPVKYRLYRNDPVFISGFNIGRSKNISAGGLKLAVSRHNPINTKLDMEIELSRTLGVYLTAKVVGGEDLEIDDIVHRFDRVSFEEVDKDVQDLLLRLVFELMKQKRSKNQ
jgi:c-di-GMP-binding flagellar brake protein YcgR